jgi:hypothetical protein
MTLPVEVLLLFGSSCDTGVGAAGDRDGKVEEEEDADPFVSLRRGLGDSLGSVAVVVFAEANDATASPSSATATAFASFSYASDAASVASFSGGNEIVTREARNAGSFSMGLLRLLLNATTSFLSDTE